MTRRGERGRRAVLVLAVGVLATVAVTTSLELAPGEGVTAAAQSVEEQAAPRTPLLAFYYQWFDARAWGRAKRDYPAVGRYSSDDPEVMRTQIRQAQSAGIDGFIVSWKSMPRNNRRLRRLMQVAHDEHFSLAMIYQGLDFNRRPLPASRVAADFALFARDFATDPVFLRQRGKALTIWSGTWAFSAGDVSKVTAPVRGRLLVLNTEKNVAGIERLRRLTDGDAYYWSSVDPTTNRHYAAKLQEMSKAVHAFGGYWIAPFAPGFDARAVGGTHRVERRNGQTLRAEYTAAVSSSPDALGLISWNEFSENTYVEPSVQLGDAELRTLRDLRNVTAPVPPSAADSSQPADAAAAPSARPGAGGSALRLSRVTDEVLAVLAGLLVLLLVPAAWLTRTLLSRRSLRRGSAYALMTRSERPHENW
jgi:Glycosyl hydrolase family 99